MSATIIPLRREMPAPPADPVLKRLYWGAYARAQAERAGRPAEEVQAAFAALTPGEAEILKLLRRIDRKLARRRT